jgi:hypothetical protein
VIEELQSGRADVPFIAMPIQHTVGGHHVFIVHNSNVSNIGRNDIGAFNMVKRNWFDTSLSMLGSFFSCHALQTPILRAHAL